ncbi:hypothetical protein D3C77_614460 [compost metagenome]
MPSRELLGACCHLLTGLCLDETLPGRSEQADVDLYRIAAVQAFDDEEIGHGARRALDAARQALEQTGDCDALGLLERALAQRSTPAQSLLASQRMFRPGGLA